MSLKCLGSVDLDEFQGHGGSYSSIYTLATLISCVHVITTKNQMVTEIAKVLISMKSIMMSTYPT